MTTFNTLLTSAANNSSSQEKHPRLPHVIRDQVSSMNGDILTTLGQGYGNVKQRCFNDTKPKLIRCGNFVSAGCIALIN